jgi:hypothetical protein
LELHDLKPTLCVPRYQNKRSSSRRRQTPRRVTIKKTTIKTRSKKKTKKGTRKNRSRMVSAPVSSSAVTVSMAPRIQSTRDFAVIEQRELVATIFDSSDFAVVNTFPINPGLPHSFPWLSTQAVGWESYSFEYLEYEYFTRSGTAQTGTLMLVPDFDAADPPPVSEQVASAFEHTVADVPWKQMRCNLPPRALQRVNKRHFVRTTTTLPPNQDVRLYDAANFYVCSTDGSGGQKVGKLWVKYRVKFFNPQLPSAGGGGGPPGELKQALAATYDLEANAGAMIPLNNGDQFDNMGSTFVRSGSSTICRFNSSFIEPNQVYIVTIKGFFSPSGAPTNTLNFWSPSAVLNCFAVAIFDAPIVSLAPQNGSFTTCEIFYTTSSGQFGFTIDDNVVTGWAQPTITDGIFGISQVNSDAWILTSSHLPRLRGLADQKTENKESDHEDFQVLPKIVTIRAVCDGTGRK